MMSAARIKIAILVAIIAFFGVGAGAVHALLATYPSTTTIEAETFFQDQPIPPKHAGSLHIPILIYHSVRPDFPGETQEQKIYNVPPDLFETQLSYLEKNGYTVISMDDLVHDLTAGNTGTVQKPVVITFDDGWRNQYVYAFPLLKAHHMNATFFVFTNPILNNKPHFMSWDNLKEMQASGMIIGSHTITHPYLSKLSPAELSHEIIDSKKTIEEKLGTVVKHFASPFGYSDDNVVSLLKQAGYETGRTTYRGAYHAKADMLTLSGFMVTSRDMKTFEWYIRDAD